MKGYIDFDGWLKKNGYSMESQSFFDLLFLPIFPLAWLFNGGKSFYQTQRDAYAKQYVSERKRWFKEMGYL